MDAQTFLENFATIAKAPGGVDQLRLTVLTLAFTGRLEPQRQSDGPPPTLRVSPESGSSRRQSVVEADAIPVTWKLASFGEVADCRLGKMLDRAKNTGPRRSYLRNANVQWFRFDLSDLHSLQLEDRDLDSHSVHAGDLVICEGGEPGRSAVCDSSIEGLVIQKALHRARPIAGMNAWYLAYLLRRLSATGDLAKFFTGATIRHLTGQSLARVPVPVPPTGEQDRIVARVDELMRLCDELEARKVRRQSATTRFQGSILRELTDAETSADLGLAWEQASANWSTLTGGPPDVAPLRDTVLQLAVRGRLVAQGSIGSATAELDQAREKKAVQSGMRQQPALPPIIQPTSILPTGWTWATVDDHFLVTGGLQKSSKRRPQMNHHPYLRVANVQRGRLDLAQIERFELYDGELDRLRLKAGDLLVVEGNGSETEIGRCARWNGEINDCVHQNHLIRCRPMLEGFEYYLQLFLNSPAGMETMRRLAVTTSGLYNLSVAKIRAIVVPVPPLEEQTRIRTRVEQLMRLCDQLEEQLKGQRQLQERFATSAAGSIARSPERVTA